MEALSDLAALKVLSLLSGQIAGEDSTNNWLGVANAASGNKYIKPLTPGDASTYGAANSSSGVIIGTTGASGDYIESLVVSVSNSTASRVVLQDGANNYTIANGGTGVQTWSSGAPTTVNFGTNTTALTLAQAQAYVNQYLIGTWTVGGYSIVTARKILAAVATTGGSGTYICSLTIDSPNVNGVAPTALNVAAATMFIYPCIELVPNNMSGNDVIALRTKSGFGGWRLFHDTGVSCFFTGRFT